MSVTFLKVKIASLASEACIIRREENKLKRRNRNKYRPLWMQLNGHRRFVVRIEARHSQLAYGFLRGRAYRAMERKTYDKVDAAKIADMVMRFGKVSKKDAQEKIDL